MHVTREILEILHKKIQLRTVTRTDGCSTYSDKGVSEIKHDKKAYSVCKTVYFFNHPNASNGQNHVLTRSCKTQNCITSSHLFYEDSSSKTAIWRRISRDAKSEGDCILSQCTVHHSGYGQLKIAGKIYALHRVVYWIFSNYTTIGDLPDFKNTRMLVRHKCKNLLCINHQHYELGTAQDNMADKKRDGTTGDGERNGRAQMSLEQAQALADTWKPRGHPSRMSLGERARAFGVRLGIVENLDARITWEEVVHPNGKVYKPPYVKKKTEEPRNNDIDWTLVSSVLAEKKTVQATSAIFNGSNCWIYRRKKDGPIFLSIAKRIKSYHIWAAELTEKRVAKPGEQARHLCGFGRCINPAHLKLGTALENARDKRAHGTAGKKLDWEKAQEIRASDRAAKDLAAEYGVTTSVVYGIRNNKIWKA